MLFSPLLQKWHLPFIGDAKPQLQLAIMLHKSLDPAALRRTLSDVLPKMNFN
jgi:hypothetical protein